MASNQTRVRRIADPIFIALFLAGLCAPMADRLFDLDSSPGLTENRVLAKAPDFPSAWSTVSAFTSAFDAYWNDSFGFRRQLIRLHALARYALRVSPSPLVVVGRDGWLFYTGDQAIENYRGIRQFSKEELERWQHQLEARRDWLARKGVHYLFVVAPEKSTIYSKKIPSRFNQVASSPLDQLMQHLATHSTVDVLDLRPVVRAAKKHAQVYSQTDTHWNDHGAYAGYVAIIERLRAWYPELQARPLSTFASRRGQLWSGDLSAMLGLKDLLTEERLELVPKPPWSSREMPNVPPPPGSARYVVMEGPSPAAPRAVVLHDSFFLPPEERGDPNAPTRTDIYQPKDSPFRMAPLLAEHFSRSAFSWQYGFDASTIERERPDVVIQEQVERSLNFGPQGAVPSN